MAHRSDLASLAETPDPDTRHIHPVPDVVPHGMLDDQAARVTAKETAVRKGLEVLRKIASQDSPMEAASNSTELDFTSWKALLGECVPCQRTPTPGRSINPVSGSFRSFRSFRSSLSHPLP